MRFPFRAIIIGILIGAALFFAPFGFPFFFLPFILVVLLFKFLFFRRGRYWVDSPWGHRHFYEHYQGAVPIDGYHPASPQRGGGEERAHNIH